MQSTGSRNCARLVLVLGDQLDRNSPILARFNTKTDCLFMAEVQGESTHVWSHKARTTLFLSAMRHFAAEMRSRHFKVDYIELETPGNTQTLEGELTRALERHQPAEVVFVEPGDFRVREAILKCLKRASQPYQELPDSHFLCSRKEFEDHAKGRKQLRMEFFYRPMRVKHQILMDGGKPAGGAWNFDAENRSSFDSTGPGWIPPPAAFTPDSITQDVIRTVNRVFPDHPGSLDSFDWPIKPDQALVALEDFVHHRLPYFGAYQDALWQQQPYLYHSRLSAALNLKLIDPLTVCRRAERAWKEKEAPLPAVEGFIRQILGWREYVRGIYWLHMPGYLEQNALKAEFPLPAFYWTGETDMVCLGDTIQQTLRLGYAHHIQRLMVTGLFALLLGVDPQKVHAWYLAVYVDAVEWVELPNTLGMSQFADGGIMASKPYAATGKYIQRMSNYCSGCRYRPEDATGESACPFTTLYWDFLERHQALLAKNPRMALQVKNLTRLTQIQRQEISRQAGKIRLKMVPNPSGAKTGK